MKNKNRGIIVLLVVLVIYGVTAVFTGKGSGSNQPDYTVFNTERNGVSLLYDTLKALRYPVGILVTPVDAWTPRNDVVVVVEPDFRYCSEDDMEHMLNWVYGGGRLAFFGGNGMQIEHYLDEGPYDADDYFALYTYGLGEILVGYTSDIINESLKDDTYPGKFMQLMLEEWQYDHIMFNEYVHGFQQKPNFFNILPTGLKIIFLQLGLVAAMLVWHLGKRFGKPIPYYEEIEREENEYIKTLGVIYKNAGKGEVITESLYDHFLHTSATFFGTSYPYTKENIVSLWREHHLAHLSELVWLEKAIQSGGLCNTKRRAGRSKFQQTVKTIKKLTAQVALRY